MNQKRAAAYRLSALVAIGLAALTILEYFLGLWHASTVIMFLIALIKGLMVVNYFMHVSRLWSQEGEH